MKFLRVLAVLGIVFSLANGKPDIDVGVVTDNVLQASAQKTTISEFIEGAKQYAKQAIEQIAQEQQKQQPVSGSKKQYVHMPRCATGGGSDAFDLECLQLGLDVCPEGQQMMSEFRVSGGLKLSTGNQICARPDDPNVAPIAEVANGESEIIEIVVTLEDLQRLKVAPTKVLSANFKREGKYVGLRKQPIHMWTEAGEITRTITMLGQQVQIKLTPVSFLWDDCDGTTQTTKTGGGAVDASFEGETKTSHAYTETGTYTAQVTVTYGGQFRVGDGDWVPVVGFLEIPSETASMDIWRKKVYPVDENCDENPDGWGCDSLFQEDKPTG